jgi:hypothetical protein
MSKFISNIPKFSYKILNLSDALVFSTLGKFLGTNHDMSNGSIHLSSNIQQCKYVINKFYPCQSITVYKLDNEKLQNVREKINKNGDVFLKCDTPIYKNSIIKTFDIYHDDSNILEYWKKINKLDDLFEQNEKDKKIFIKEYAIKY